MMGEKGNGWLRVAVYGPIIAFTIVLDGLILLPRYRSMIPVDVVVTIMALASLNYLRVCEQTTGLRWPSPEIMSRHGWRIVWMYLVLIPLLLALSNNHGPSTNDVVIALLTPPVPLLPALATSYAEYEVRCEEELLTTTPTAPTESGLT